MTADARSSRSSIPAPLAVLILVACLLAANLAAGGLRRGDTDLAPGRAERPEAPATSPQGGDGDGTTTEAQDGGVGAIRPAG